MTGNGLVAKLQEMIKENPAVGEMQLAQQSCFDAPKAYSGNQNVYLGTVYESEEGECYLSEEDLKADDEEPGKQFPAIIIECF